DRLALGADGDFALALARDENGLVDLYRAVLALFPRVGLYSQFIGKLFMQTQEGLLARDLGGEHARRRVHGLIFRKEPRPLRRALRQHFRQILDAIAAPR